MQNNMKHLKIFSVLFCGVAAIALTSCLNDDNDKGLTPEEKQQAFLQMNGSYTAKTIYYSKLDGMSSTPGNKRDTLNAQLNLLNDSTIQLGLPTKAIVSLMRDTMLAKAIAAQQPQKGVTARIGFYNVNPPAFYVNPQPVEYNNISYKGTTVSFRFVFANNYVSSFGVYNAKKRTLGINLIVAGVYRDGHLDNTILQQAAPVLVVGTRH